MKIRKILTDKNGISLIVLVITIIIMIIIAGAVILSLSFSSIVNKAKESVEKANLKSVQDAASLAYSDYRLNGETASLSEYIKNWLIDKNYISENNAEKYVFDESGKVLSRNGLQEVTLSGTNISQSNTYNDSAFLKIYGKSEQEGEPSPDYPSAINSVSKFNLATSGINLWSLSPTYIADTANNIFTSAGSGTFTIPLTINQPYTLVADITRYPDDNITEPRFTIKINYTDGTNNASWGNTYDNIPKDGITRRYAVSVTPTVGKKVSNVAGWILDHGRYYYRNIKAENIMLILGTYNINTVPKYEPYKVSKNNFSYTLRSLPDGTKDYIEIDNVNKTAKLYTKIGEKIFRGIENWQVMNAGYDGAGFTRFGLYVNSNLVGQSNSTTNLLCSHLISKGWNNGSITTNNVHTYNFDNRIGIAIDNNIIGIAPGDSNSTRCTKLKAWLTSQYTASTPVTVQYKLAETIIEDLDYNEIKTFYPYTQIYTNATVQPKLEAKIRISD